MIVKFLFATHRIFIVSLLRFCDKTRTSNVPLLWLVELEVDENFVNYAVWYEQAESIPEEVPVESELADKDTEEAPIESEPVDKDTDEASVEFKPCAFV